MGESQWGTFRSALAGALIAAVLFSAPAVTAAVGNAMKIGQVNRGNATTTLKGASSTTLKLVNTTAGEEALRLQVVSGPALMVNTGDRIPKLNADKLDGKHRSFFMAKSTYDSDRNGVVDTTDSRTTWVDCHAGDTPKGQDWRCDLTITVPHPGTFLMEGSVEVWYTGTTDDLVSCMFRLNDVSGGIQGSWRSINVGTGGSQRAVCTSHARMTAQTAGTYNLSFDLTNVDADTDPGHGLAWVMFLSP